MLVLGAGVLGQGVLPPELRQAQQLEVMGRYDEAFAYYRVLALRFPSNPVYLEGALRSLKALRDDQRLLEFLEEALQVAPGNPRILCELASLRYRAGAREEAMRLWRGLLDEPGATPDTYGLVGSAMLEAGLRDEVVALYHEARQRFRDPTLFVLEMANLHLARRDFRAAAREYTSYLLSHPEAHPLVESSLGAALEGCDEGDIRRALEELQRAATVHAEHLGLRVALGGLMVRLGRYREAFSELLQAEQLQGTRGATRAPAFGQHLIRVAEAALRGGDRQTAQLAFETILREAPAGPFAPRARLGLAELWGESGRVAEACRVYLEFARANPASPQAPLAFRRAAELLRGHLGLTDSAREVASEIVRRYPATPAGLEAGILLGEWDLAEGRYEKAAATLHSIASLAANRWPEIRERALFELAQILFFRSEWDSAITVLEGLVSPRQTERGEGQYANDAIELLLLIRAGRMADPEVLRCVARARERILSGQPDSAVAVLRECAEGRPQSPLVDRLWFELGNAAEQAGRLREAVAAFRNVVSLFPSSLLADQAQWRLGQCLERSGDPEGARKAYEMLLTNYPQSVYLEAARKRIRALQGRS